MWTTSLNIYKLMWTTLLKFKGVITLLNIWGFKFEKSILEPTTYV